MSGSMPKTSLGSKHMAKPAEGGHHLVGDVEDVVVAADLADAPQIAIAAAR